MNKQVKDKKVYKLNVIKTPANCYVNNKGADRYGGSIEHLLFNGSKPEKTNKKYWYKVKVLPTIIQVKGSDEKVNVRYELKEGYPESELTPKVINMSSLYDTKYDAVSGLYQYMNDTVKGELEDVEFELNIVAERDASFSVSDDKVNEEKLSYAILDEIETNPMLLHEKPCRLSGESMYRIVETFLDANIDRTVAELEKGYKKYTIYKKVRLAKPYTTKRNANSNDKRRKARWIETYHDSNKKFLFSFESGGSRYNDYPPEISGKDIYDLQKRLDKYLDDMLIKINTPYTECKHCDGVGVLIEE